MVASSRRIVACPGVGWRVPYVTDWDYGQGATHALPDINAIVNALPWQPGDNVVSVVARVPKGSSALVMIWDGIE